VHGVQGRRFEVGGCEGAECVACMRYGAYALEAGEEVCGCGVWFFSRWERAGGDEDVGEWLLKLGCVLAIHALCSCSALQGAYKHRTPRLLCL
jgi:hypothetical protein